MEIKESISEGFYAEFLPPHPDPRSGFTETQNRVNADSNRMLNS
jgi:hypothetical protein